MIVFYDENNKVTSYQTFPETTTAPNAAYVDPAEEDIVREFSEYLRVKPGRILVENPASLQVEEQDVMVLDIPEDVHERKAADLLEESRDKARAYTFLWREAKRQEGMPYTIQGTLDSIQIRDTQDMVNINGLVTVAQMAEASGNTEFTASFRADSNTTYTLSLTEIYNLGAATVAYVEGIYAQSWSAKDAIETAATVEEMNAALATLNSEYSV